MYRYHFISEMLNTFETFEVKEMCTFKHEPFFIVGGGAYLWYFTVLMNVNGTIVCLHFNF